MSLHCVEYIRYYTLQCALFVCDDWLQVFPEGVNIEDTLKFYTRVSSLIHCLFQFDHVDV